MEIIHKPYNVLTQKEKNDIIDMLSKIWSSFINTYEIHHEDLDVYSFYIYDQKKVIAYTGVVLQTIRFHDRTLKVASLSCVAVSSEYQRKGIGKMIVDRATEWIKTQPIDIGIFTCHPSLVNFYTDNSHWKIADNVILKGNHHQRAISSDTIKVIVIICNFTKDLIIKNTTLYLNLPNNQFV